MTLKPDRAVKDDYFIMYLSQNRVFGEGQETSLPEYGSDLEAIKTDDNIADFPNEFTCIVTRTRTISSSQVALSVENNQLKRQRDSTIVVNSKKIVFNIHCSHKTSVAHSATHNNKIHCQLL